MEAKVDNPVEGKTEQLSGCLLYTYFHGDINSMVDEHFSRALSKASKPKTDSSNTKKTCKSAKTDQSSNWDMQSTEQFDSLYFPGRIQFGRQEEPQRRVPPVTTESSSIWPGSHPSGAGVALPPMMYPTSMASAESMMGPDPQYSSSLLNLLHRDQPDLGTVLVGTSKQEFPPGWMRHSALGDQITPHHSLDSGAQDKKNLYWY
ncbi:transcription cofactor vestigial-like protein 1 [Hoplias malabaricus]|uniref:transcription cofactor vestigial-like protein 1 n=1 Tax=Hoplias malabaricus TaxID=27720 RepID=UPI0034637A1F